MGKDAGLFCGVVALYSHHPRSDVMARRALRLWWDRNLGLKGEGTYRVGMRRRTLAEPYLLWIKTPTMAQRALPLPWEHFAKGHADDGSPSQRRNDAEAGRDDSPQRQRQEV